MIESDIWTDEHISQLDYAGRLFWIGIITLANDFGKLKGHPDYLKSSIFPYDKVKPEVEKYIDFLIQKEKIFFWESKGEKFIQIKNWKKYQTLTYIGKDNFPKIDDKQLLLSSCLTNPEQTLNKPLTPIKINVVKVNLVKKTQSQSSCEVGNTDKYELKTDLQKVVCAYKMLKGFKKDDRDWDKLNYKRCSKSAKQLLEYFKQDGRRTINCMEDISNELVSKGLDWSFETLVKRSADWKLKNLGGGG